MSRKEIEQIYFRMLKDRWGRVDKNNLKQIRDYNEWKKQLRHDLLDED